MYIGDGFPEKKITFDNQFFLSNPAFIFVYTELCILYI